MSRIIQPTIYRSDMDKCSIIHGDCLAILDTIADKSIQCCVTSPPYYGLRDYKTEGQIGLEETPELYIEKMVRVFREVRRVLKDDGTLWLNIGDSYAGPGRGAWDATPERKVKVKEAYMPTRAESPTAGKTFGLKQKDLIGIPWMLAFALRADGWYLRQDIIWCLSGGTLLYVRTQKGDMPMTVKDLSRLDPSTVRLWSGEKWTRLLGMNKSARRGDELEIVLRSGERISCTPTHRFPTTEGVVNAGCLKVGDTLMSCRLPEPDVVMDCAIDEDAAWFAGLYVAEGSMSGDTIQIAGHAKEHERWERVQRIATKFGGTATVAVYGNNMSIRVYGKFMNAIVGELVSGKTAHDKGFAPVVWRYSDKFIAAMIDGYLSGDGHKNGARWRLGFCRNYNLERDLRTACARLGYTLTLNLSSAEYNGNRVPIFRGELRKERSGHHNERDRNEIVEIRKARCRNVYDLGVEDDPHLFALSSGVLTHNSKPNPMPESVTDRCTKAHEYIFLFSKSQRYYYDAAAIREPAVYGGNEARYARAEADHKSVPTSQRNGIRPRSWNGSDFHDGKNLINHPNVSKNCQRKPAGWDTGKGGHGSFHRYGRSAEIEYTEGVSETRNKRSVWTVATKPFKEAHFATFPPDLIKPCILAGSREGDTVLDPFSGAGTTGEVSLTYWRKYKGIEINPDYVAMSKNRLDFLSRQEILFNQADQS